MSGNEFSNLLHGYVELAIAAYNDDTAISQRKAEEACAEVIAFVDRLQRELHHERTVFQAEVDRFQAERAQMAAILEAAQRVSQVFVEFAPMSESDQALANAVRAHNTLRLNAGGTKHTDYELHQAPEAPAGPTRGILAQAVCGCPVYSDTKLVEHHHGCPVPGAAAAAKAWNETYGPFSRQVRYWKGAREGEGQTSATRTPAQVLSGHTAVIWVKAEGACIALTHIEVLDDLCKTCRNPQAIHYCRSCSDGTEPGPGCINCRNTGWCQNPCLPPHRWTRHGWRCCDEASEERPPWAIAKCGGPAICVVCKTERAEMAGHAKPASSNQPKDGTQP